VQVKKQVFELLSALCVYSSEGYSRALEALEHYKTFRSERYRFKLVVDELRDAKSNEYKTVLLAFINCLIISTPQLKVSNTLNSIFCVTTQCGNYENLLCVHYAPETFKRPCRNQIILLPLQFYVNSNFS